jgi:hypothetical protein
MKNMSTEKMLRLLAHPLLLASAAAGYILATVWTAMAH